MRLLRTLAVADLQFAALANLPGYDTVACLDTSDPASQMEAKGHQIIGIYLKAGHFALQGLRQGFRQLRQGRIRRESKGTYSHELSIDQPNHRPLLPSLRETASVVSRMKAYSKATSSR